MYYEENKKSNSLLAPRELLHLKLKYNKLLNEYKKAMTDLGYATYDKVIYKNLKDEELEKFVIRIKELEMEMEKLNEIIY
ncbi:hypothetical protein [Tepidimicrobium xylanilyticum]|uniref:Uncharacterized protein n=1 Tax=Tepidimicrobium xylanilyticum TaxID=1123352 RepID=A0A1H2WA55_9FIRM|nr:hypothetical protein [Tepidimicrobium xylanilyticum]GMG95308.1 hypothetical protein EN5CB1_01340 [Tepidimicrobium xylanilyticum]SDW76929.1 hypothetical protein SAMN05660923_01193 [Tepidimicrobium xylanilyticum]